MDKTVVQNFETAIKDFVAGYEVDTGEGIYQPNEHERFLIDMAIRDAIHDDDFGPALAAIAAAPAPAAQDERERRTLTWSQPLPPDDEIHYNHVTAKTPFGRILITWKGWKDNPDFAIDEHPLEGVVHWNGFSLESTKAEAEERYFAAVEVALTAPQDAQERNAIIEECAKVCDDQATEPECPERAKYCADAIRALKTAQPADKPEGKAEQQAEPVAWMTNGSAGFPVYATTPFDESCVWTPLYAHPSAQPQQLTDKEIVAVYRRTFPQWQCVFTDDAVRFARALLAAGKEKK